MSAYRAYFDDSGNEIDPHHSACAIAGFLGTVDAWAAFQKEWRRLLADELHIPWLHMRSFAHSLPPFDQLTEEGRIRVLKSMIKTIKECGLSGFGVTIRLPDLRRFNAERLRGVEALPLALYVCMNDIYMEDPWRPVQIVLDKFEKPYNVIKKAKAIAASHWSDDVSRNADCVPLKGNESYKSVLPLQAADLIAYEIKKNVENRRGWFDSAMDDDPETWETTERRWLASKGLSYPYLRKSLSGLLEEIPVTISIWDYRILCQIDDKRGGKWSA